MQYIRNDAYSTVFLHKKTSRKKFSNLRFLYLKYSYFATIFLFYAAVEGAERAVYVFHKRKSVVVLFEYLFACGDLTAVDDANENLLVRMTVCAHAR